MLYEIDEGSVHSLNTIIENIVCESSKDDVTVWYDRHGEPILWEYKNWLFDIKKKKVAFIHGNNIWTLNKDFLAQIQDGVARDSEGKILLFQNEIKVQRKIIKPVGITAPTKPRSRTLGRIIVPQSITVNIPRSFFSKKTI